MERDNNGHENVLCELAKVMRGMDRHLTATALYTLARKGFTSLSEVEEVTDGELLAIGGIGPGRLGAIRLLTRPDWQPPSRQALRAARRLLDTAQLALRFWSVEDLESALQGPEPPSSGNGSAESRLSIEAFANAVRAAMDHHEPDTLKQIVRRAGRLAESSPSAGGDR